MVNFYGRFIPNLAQHLSPMHKQIAQCRKNKRKFENFEWPPECNEGFVKSKQLLKEATLLVHPMKDAVISITSDASDIALGAVLQQFDSISKIWQPLSFFSRKLSPAETRYNTFDRELLAMYQAVKHFRYFIEGREFILFTDHHYVRLCYNIKIRKKSSANTSFGFGSTIYN